ncbi:hypothetical protein MRX96_008188 [Rhipicephalus microplus]
MQERTSVLSKDPAAFPNRGCDSTDFSLLSYAGGGLRCEAKTQRLYQIEAVIPQIFRGGLRCEAKTQRLYQIEAVIPQIFRDGLRCEANTQRLSQIEAVIPQIFRGGLRCEAKAKRLYQIEAVIPQIFRGGLRCEANTQRLSQIEAVIPQISQRWTSVRSKDPAAFPNRGCDSTDFSLMSYAGGGLRCEAKTKRLSQIEAVIPQISQRWTSVRRKDPAAFPNRGCDSTNFSLLSYAEDGLRCEAKTQWLSQLEAVIPQISHCCLMQEVDLGAKQTQWLSQIEAVIPQISKRWTSVRSKDPAAFPNRDCGSTDFSLLSYAGGGLRCEAKIQRLSQIEAVIPQISHCCLMQEVDFGAKQTQWLSQIEAVNSADFSLLSYAGGGLRCEANTQRLSQIEAVIPQISHCCLMQEVDFGVKQTQWLSQIEAVIPQISHCCLMQVVDFGVKQTQWLSQIEAVIPQISQRWTSVRSKDQAAFPNRGCDSTDFSLLSYAGGGFRCEAKTKRLAQIEAVIPPISHCCLMQEVDFGAKQTQWLSQIEAVIPPISHCCLMQEVDFGAKQTQWLSQIESVIPQISHCCLMQEVDFGAKQTQWLSQIESVIPQISHCCLMQEVDFGAKQTQWLSQIESVIPQISHCCLMQEVDFGAKQTQWLSQIEAVIPQISHCCLMQEVDFGAKQTQWLSQIEAVIPQISHCCLMQEVDFGAKQTQWLSQIEAVIPQISHCCLMQEVDFGAKQTQWLSQIEAVIPQISHCCLMQEVDFGAKQRPSGFPKSSCESTDFSLLSDAGGGLRCEAKTKQLSQIEAVIPPISQRWTSVRSKDPAAFPNRGCDSTDFSLLSYAGGGLRCEAKTQRLSQIEAVIPQISQRWTSVRSKDPAAFPNRGCDSTDFSLLSYAGGGLRCEAKTQRLSQIEAVIPKISQRWTSVRSKDPAAFPNRGCDSKDFSLLSYAGGGLRCEAKTQRLSQIEAVIPKISQRWTSVRSKDPAAFPNRGCDSKDFSLLSYAGGGLRCEEKTQQLSQIEAVIPQISQRWTSVRSKDPAAFPNRGCDSTDFSLLSYAGGGLRCEEKTQRLSQIEAVIPQISQRWTSVRSKDPAAFPNRGCDSTDFSLLSYAGGGLRCEEKTQRLSQIEAVIPQISHCCLMQEVDFGAKRRPERLSQIEAVIPQISHCCLMQEVDFGAKQRPGHFPQIEAAIPQISHCCLMQEVDFGAKQSLSGFPKSRL